MMSAVVNAVAAPDYWPQAFEIVAKFFGGAGAMAEFHEDDGRHIVLGPRSGLFSDKQLSDYINHYAAICPRPPVMTNPLMPAVQTDRLVAPDEELWKNPFFAEFLREDRLGHYLGFRLKLNGSRSSVLAIHRDIRAGHPTDEEVDWMTKLGPFFRAAFRARALFGDTPLFDSNLMLRLSRMKSPLVFLDERGALLFQNDGASALLARGAAPDWSALLARWLQLSAGLEDGSEVTVPSPDGAWSARIVDLRGTVDAFGAGGVYVAMLSPTTARPSQYLARHLTQAETQVLDHLIAGLTPAEIAAAQGVSMATTRTHIARLHEKFGVGRTLDVVRLALAEGYGKS